MWRDTNRTNEPEGVIGYLKEAPKEKWDGVERRQWDGSERREVQTFDSLPDPDLQIK